MLGNEYIIHEAASGEECIDLLSQYGTGISLVLLDIIMPEMDGFEVLDYMAEHHWIDDIPVIMISSEDSASSIRKAYEFGVSDYISVCSIPLSFMQNSAGLFPLSATRCTKKIKTTV